MIKYYKVAGMKIRLEMPDELPIPENMGRFEEPESAKQDIDSSYKISLVDMDQEQVIHPIMESWKNAEQYVRKNMLVLVAEDLECRLLNFEGDKIPYAIVEELSFGETRVLVNKVYQSLFSYETIFSSVLAMERHLLGHEALILHSAYICVGGEAVLFSAPSGTGKSTQAGLWCQYRQSRQINGDDSILKKQEGRWYAHGFQVCGSSNICLNESYPIKAIVMLYQARENTCRKLRPIEAFSKIYPQIKINMWSSDFQEKAMNLLENLIWEVPVVELGCTISEEAVNCLEEYLANLS